MAKRFHTFKKPIKLKDLKKTKKRNTQSKQDNKNSLDNKELSECLEGNFKDLKVMFKDCFDVEFREFTLGQNKSRCILAYIQEIVDTDNINENFLHSLMLDSEDEYISEDEESIMNTIKNKSITIGGIKKITLLKEAVKDILDGNCVFLISNSSIALSLSTQNWNHRSIEEPVTESVVRGPLEGFTEAISVNISQIRKRLKTHNLKMENMEIGRLSRTQVVISYINGIADEGIINEVKERLERVDVDSINDSGEIEQFIEDSPFSPFPQISYTERPDIVSASLSEGQIVVLVDGSPIVLILPAVLAHFLSSPEDYYTRFYFGTFIRVLRYIAFGIALFLPSIYVAMTTYHQEMIPMPLLTTLIAVRAAVPFPAVVEAFMMEFTFEVLREAGIRLPKPIGQAVSIVGALILGELAVSVGIVSNAMVIIVAFTGISSFVIPKYNQSISIRLLRFPLMILAGSLGLFGIIIGFLFILIHLASIRSFGVPYLSPFAPISLSDWKDTLVRFPTWFMTKRPRFMNKKNLKKMKKNLRPKPNTNN
ncbi:spore germination protein [Herbivorax sp. ANBcel31]|uniref:spore germination protein n=1 Tax=Herbivorax sp. ANBcel31 TaxID=3069754 RepID=UPI0027AEC7AF|nr:spore germination protein [Herbivorax sp. ANBcel31]MDQ2085577.1 spore germination protein [Herbivorax sp. ANBcel31]